MPQSGRHDRVGSDLFPAIISAIFLIVHAAIWGADSCGAHIPRRSQSNIQIRAKSGKIVKTTSMTYIFPSTACILGLEI